MDFRDKNLTAIGSKAMLVPSMDPTLHCRAYRAPELTLKLPSLFQAVYTISTLLHSLSTLTILFIVELYQGPGDPFGPYGSSWII